ncbi:hypothetical protein HX744_26085 [Pseudonocardia sp. ICBG1122]|nr:hypothetical protein [Pseudonocardia pini]
MTSPAAEPRVDDLGFDAVASLVNAVSPEAFYSRAAASDRVASVLGELRTDLDRWTRGLPSVLRGASGEAAVAIGGRVTTAVTGLRDAVSSPGDGTLLRRAGDALSANQQRMRELQARRSAEGPTAFTAEGEARYAEAARRVLADLESAYRAVGQDLTALPGADGVKVRETTPPPFGTGSSGSEAGMHAPLAVAVLSARAGASGTGMEPGQPVVGRTAPPRRVSGAGTEGLGSDAPVPGALGRPDADAAGGPAAGVPAASGTVLSGGVAGAATGLGAGTGALGLRRASFADATVGSSPSGVLGRAVPRAGGGADRTQPAIETVANSDALAPLPVAAPDALGAWGADLLRGRTPTTSGRPSAGGGSEIGGPKEGGYVDGRAGSGGLDGPDRQAGSVPASIAPGPDPGPAPGPGSGAAGAHPVASMPSAGASSAASGAPTPPQALLESPRPVAPAGSATAEPIVETRTLGATPLGAGSTGSGPSPFMPPIGGMGPMGGVRDVPGRDPEVDLQADPDAWGPDGGAPAALGRPSRH